MRCPARVIHGGESPLFYWSKSLSTLSELISRVRSRADMQNSTFVTDAEITTWLNLGGAELYDMLVDANEDYFTISAVSTVPQGGSAVTPPADFYKLRGLDVAVGPKWRAVDQINFRDRNTNDDSWFNGLYGIVAQVRYRIVHNQVDLMPVNRAPGTYRLWYIPAFPKLVTSAQELPPSMSNFGWDEYMVLYAAERCLAKEESPVTDVKAERMEIATRIEKMAANRQLDRPDTVADTGWYYDGYGRFYVD